MANEESPYEKLDLSYFEMPVPNTEEVTAVRFLSKQGLADLWSKISEKFIRPVSGGTEGQVLTYKGTGLYSWDDVSSFPEGGTTGQALIKTDDGVAWGDVATDIPEATSEVYGTVRFATDEEFNSFMGLPSE